MRLSPFATAANPARVPVTDRVRGCAPDSTASC